MKTDRTIWVSISDLIARSALMTWNAGATIEDDTGDTNMNKEFRIVMRQRFVSVQFFGLFESFKPSQPTFIPKRIVSKCQGNIKGDFSSSY